MSGILNYLASYVTDICLFIYLIKLWTDLKNSLFLTYVIVKNEKVCSLGNFNGCFISVYFNTLMIIL